MYQRCTTSVLTLTVRTSLTSGRSVLSGVRWSAVWLARSMSAPTWTSCWRNTTQQHYLPMWWVHHNNCQHVEDFLVTWTHWWPWFLHKTFTHLFYWKQIILFWLKFHSHQFQLTIKSPGVQLTISWHLGHCLVHYLQPVAYWVHDYCTWQLTVLFLWWSFVTPW